VEHHGQLERRRLTVPDATSLQAPKPDAGAVIRAIIVDDEQLARRGIRARLERAGGYHVVAECASGREAIAAIREHQPGVVFLDVQMPGVDGFGVINAIGADRMPTVIFVTAYDEYALRAFEVHALDYLLKPFGRERFRETLKHARASLERRRAGDLGRRLLALVNDIKPEAPKLDRLVVKSGGRVFFLRTEDLDWIEAAGNYVRLHLGEEAHLFRETMTHMEARLDTRRFVRIHRSRIVNTERIKELQPWFNGEYVVVLRNGTRLPLSRGYRDKLQEQLGKGF
jgi:two-component system, LytTR family, response regulator